jgi:NAD(P)-dependent dehydrogenase (short-subunit alcohol dehydrogenase family)
METQYEEIAVALKKRVTTEGSGPTVIALQGTGIFAAAATKAGADAIIRDFLASVKSGKSAQVAADIDKEDSPEKGRVAGKVAVVTGGAQGFGKGIAGALAREGAYTVIADINRPAAERFASDVCRTCGAGRALAVETDVSREDSIQSLMTETVLAYGGIDVFISNAGILKAGGLEDMDLATFELVTKINYSAFYLGTKHASRFMKIQHRFEPGRWSDIIQINSKSGLEGSNRNFAYAGGKFGSIGLTQSFALELVDFNIKVNAICPGNFFEGPLWSDPDNGLFAQYLRADKVPGARTIEDIKRFYESKIPMKRGCSADDVAKAVFYCIEQAYETGQAVPVTGGQVMLH